MLFKQLMTKHSQWRCFQVSFSVKVELIYRLFSKEKHTQFYDKK